MKSTLYYIAIFSLVLFLQSCNDKPDAPTALPDSGTVINDTSYVQIKPDWTGFNNPSDVFVGSEPFIYIADTDNDRIAMYDLAGRLMGYSGYIKKPIAISQDGYFDLLVCGEKDSVIGGNTATFGAVYRVKMKEAQHIIKDAKVQLAYMESGKPQRRFTGIAVMQDNSYFLTRVGPDNTSPFDPDNAIIIIDKHDIFQSPISSIKPIGNALGSIMDLTAISLTKNNAKDFLFLQKGEEMQYKAQWYVFSSGEVSNWVPKFDPTINQTDFLQVNKFTQPEDVCYDTYGNVYIVDAAKDSLYKFTSSGKERHSFGGRGAGERKFNRPMGVAFFDKTLYIADAGNNRIVRFRLSTDL